MGRVIVKEASTWMTKHDEVVVLGAAVRLRVLPIEKVTGMHPIVRHVAVRSESGEQLHAMHPVTNKQDWLTEVRETGLTEVDGEEHVVEFEYETGGEIMMARAEAIRPGDEIELDDFVRPALECVERALCLNANGHERCHQLKGHAGDVHTHSGGGSWLIERS